MFLEIQGQKIEGRLSQHRSPNIRQFYRSQFPSTQRSNTQLRPLMFRKITKLQCFDIDWKIDLFCQNLKPFVCNYKNFNFFKKIGIFYMRNIEVSKFDENRQWNSHNCDPLECHDCYAFWSPQRDLFLFCFGRLQDEWRLLKFRTQ